MPMGKAPTCTTREPRRTSVIGPPSSTISTSGSRFSMQVRKFRRVARGLEAQQVVGEQGLEDLAAPGEPQQDVERRERDVEEEADPGGLVLRGGMELGDVDELVVLHPDEVLLPAVARGRCRRTSR